MERARTRGHAPALAVIEAMVRGTPPHALILSGPTGVGKTTLALDLAAGLLCQAADARDRPCRECRACRLVDHGSHPDLHRLTPAGPGGQVVIGGPKSEHRGVRDLVADLALMPLEGGARVAIIEAAHRMTEDAQSALLKTLEEPPTGVTIIACADDESHLLPTVRSRCARIRLGPVGTRDIESFLGERGAADAPTAARIARLASGRPGIALAYALSSEAPRLQAELARIFIDLVDAAPAARLATIRGSMAVAMDLARAIETGIAAARGPEDTSTAARGPKRRGAARAATATAAGDLASEGIVDATSEDAPPAADVDNTPAPTVPAAHRRRAAERLIDVAIAVARDLALVGAGGARWVAAPGMLEESAAVHARIPAGSAIVALGRAERAAALVAANVNPELILDDLVLGWPSSRRVA